MAACAVRRARKKLIQAARWLLRGPERQAPDSDELAAFGLVWQEQEEELTVWPDNRDAVAACRDMLTQWSMGPSGPVGFRYEALPVVLWGLGIRGDARRQVYHDLRIMEQAILDCIYEKEHG